MIQNTKNNTTDVKIRKLIGKELERQRNTLQLIPSENYASKEVLQACSSILMNKYAEGYPKKRYYQGNTFADEIENIAIERAKKLFHAEHANVQPNSGSPANMAVYFALLEPKDKVLAMNLSDGGHLTHGSGVNFSGKTYTFIPYGVDPITETLDMDMIRKIALAEKPKIIVSGYTAYPRKIDFKAFHDIAIEVGAYSMADISHLAGLIVGGVHQSPLPFTDVVTTTTHKTLRGPRSAIILSKIEDRLKEKYHPHSKKNLAQAIDSAVFPGLQGGPHLQTIAAKAIAFQEALQPEFSTYAQQIVKNAKALAKTLMENGLQLVSGGTDTHLILINLHKTKFLDEPGLGKSMAIALEEAGIVTNANSVPFDLSTPFNPSGIRLGTAALTTRGMKEDEMKEIGLLITQVIKNSENISLKEKIKERVEELCRQYPIYTDEEY